MAVDTDDVAEIVAQLQTDEVSTGGKFYVVELVPDGDGGMDWDFDGNGTEKRSPYTFDFDAGNVYDMKVGDQDMRVMFQVEAVGGDAAAAWDVTVLDTCALGAKEIDWGAVEVAVNSDADAETLGRRNEVKALIDDADAETLDLVEKVLQDTDGDRDPGEHTVADLSAVPSEVRKDAQTFGSAFAAAFEKQTGSEPGVHLRAAALDAAVLKMKRDAQGGGD